jgi:hypothetical protein
VSELLKFVRQKVRLKMAKLNLMKAILAHAECVAYEVEVHEEKRLFLEC